MNYPRSEVSLFHIIGFYRSKELEKKLQETTEHIDSVNDEGNTPLMCAVLLREYECVKLLITYGAEIDRTNQDKETAFILAAKKGKKQILEYLFEQGAKIDSEDKYGMDALSLAALNAQVEIVEYLIEKAGIDIQFQKKFFEGKTFGELFNHKIVENCCRLYQLEEDKRIMNQEIASAMVNQAIARIRFSLERYARVSVCLRKGNITIKSLDYYLLGPLLKNSITEDMVEMNELNVMKNNIIEPFYVYLRCACHVREIENNIARYAPR